MSEKDSNIEAQRELDGSTAIVQHPPSLKAAFSTTVHVQSGTNLSHSSFSTAVHAVVRTDRTDLSSLARQIIYPDMRNLDREMQFRSTVTSSLFNSLLALAKENSIVFNPVSTSTSASTTTYMPSSSSTSMAKSHLPSPPIYSFLIIIFLNHTSFPWS